MLTCRNFAELLAAFERHGVCVALAVIDYALPGMKQAAGIRRIAEQWPSVRILVTADTCDRETILNVLTAGGHGFVPKYCSSAELKDALRATAAGQVFVSPTSTEEAAADLSGQSDPVQDLNLTARQSAVLHLLATGKSNKEIARELAISEGTVKAHVNASFRVLGVHNRVSAAAAIRAASNDLRDRPASQRRTMVTETR